MRVTSTMLVALVALAPTAGAEVQEISVLLHDWLHITPDAMTANVGDTLRLTISVPVDQQGAHDFVLPDLGVRVPLLSPGQSVPIEIEVDRAGTFEYWCSVPGHKEGGMVGTLFVADPATTPPDEGQETPSVAALAVLAIAFAAALALRRSRA